MDEKILNAMDISEIRNHVMNSQYGYPSREGNAVADLFTEITRTNGLVPVHNPIVDDWNMASFIRDVYVRFYGFVRLTEGFVDTLAEYLKGKKVLSIMSGSCTLEYHLLHRGINVICTDTNEWVDDPKRESSFAKWNSSFTKTHLEKLEASEAIRKYGHDVDYVLCTWPPYNSPAAANAIRTMNEVRVGLPMIYIGESYGGNCADDEFFELTVQIEDEAFDKVIDAYMPFRFMYDNPMLLRYDFD